MMLPGCFSCLMIALLERVGVQGAGEIGGGERRGRERESMCVCEREGGAESNKGRYIVCACLA